MPFSADRLGGHVTWTWLIDNTFSVAAGRELGDHLLLIGNQGVGKNKLADRFLQLLKLPREYIQLHRDTTVQSLTSAPTVKSGVLVYEDSPLVRAATEGACRCQTAIVGSST